MSITIEVGFGSRISVTCESVFRGRGDFPICNPSTGEVEQEDLWGLLVSQCSLLDELQASERPEVILWLTHAAHTPPDTVEHTNA